MHTHTHSYTRCWRRTEETEPVWIQRPWDMGGMGKGVQSVRVKRPWDVWNVDGGWRGGLTDETQTNSTTSINQQKQQKAQLKSKVKTNPN